MVTFSSFLPLPILSGTYFIAFLQILYLYINLISCIFYYLYLQLSGLFCTVLQLFALVLCFGDQVLSPGSSLATDFLGVVPLWRVAQEKFFQPWSYVTFSESKCTAKSSKRSRKPQNGQTCFCATASVLPFGG